MRSTIRWPRGLRQISALSILLLGGCGLPHRIDEPSRSIAGTAPETMPYTAVYRSGVGDIGPAGASTAGRPAAANAALPLPNLPGMDRPLPATAATAVAETPARAELRKVSQYTGLSDAQVAALQAARTRLAGGNEAGALTALQNLEAELAADKREHKVGDGENIFSIAGQDAVYGNSNLWPLIWRANLSSVPSPAHLTQGMVLKIPPHPTIAEIDKALEFARTHNVLNTKAADLQP